ncbi:MAG: hypothetical protein WD887_00470 [Candidatus Saccharimonadales bacterium]
MSSQKVKETVAVSRLSQTKRSVLQRFPLLFTLLVTFGVVATFYGFERLIDRVEFMADTP